MGGKYFVLILLVLLPMAHAVTSIDIIDYEQFSTQTEASTIGQTVVYEGSTTCRFWITPTAPKHANQLQYYFSAIQLPRQYNLVKRNGQSFIQGRDGELVAILPQMTIISYDQDPACYSIFYDYVGTQQTLNEETVNKLPLRKKQIVPSERVVMLKSSSIVHRAKDLNRQTAPELVMKRP